ncbi:hypothetical protein FHX08_005619 [Rhizobium sp. BK529]|uniref:hypothetical protein n=1 Tax=Rhizobium sp. BK529 TaxID=2586983 RepID=UPI001622ED02|nr:hypothetical protein [Rhizobium sp. BK529]
MEFHDLVDRTIGAGWKPEEVLVSLIEVPDNQPLMMEANAAVEALRMSRNDKAFSFSLDRHSGLGCAASPLLATMLHPHAFRNVTILAPLGKGGKRLRFFPWRPHPDVDVLLPQQ